jgi:polysaccharide biosynthesis/export protein
MMKITRRLTFLLGIISLLSSCKVFDPSVMMRTKKDYPYATASDTLPREYIIQKGDIVTFRLYSNQGFKIIDLSTLEESNKGGGQQVNIQNAFPYLVESDSSINLPILGRVKLAGFNLKEAEIYLEERYSDYYNEPFVLVQIRNRRILVFPGGGGDAKVIEISNEYITIVEALALAGGISNGGKAHRVKVIRGNLSNPEVYEVDMSTAIGLAEANMHYIRANDMIYVEPNYFVARQLLSGAGRVMSLITGSIATYYVVTTFTNRN